MNWSYAAGQLMMRLRTAPARGLAVALILSGLAFLALPAKPAHASCDGDQAWVFTATASNTSGYITTIDNGEINASSGAIPFVSQLWPSQYDPHPLGLWYDPNTARWTIFNEDGAPIPLGTSFTINRPCSGELVDKSIYRFSATSSNVNGASVSIDDPQANGNPGAVVYASQVWTGTYNAHEIGVQFNVLTGRWLIFNLDQSPMPVGASFDVAIGATAASPSTLTVTASASNTYDGYMVYLNDTRFNNHPGLAPIVSQVFPCGWGGCGAINNHPVGVWYDGAAGQWVIYNVDRASIPAGAQFFITPLV